MLSIYCFKCRKKVEINRVEGVIFKNKSRALMGVCPVCFTKCFKCIGKTQSENVDKKK